MWGERVRYRGLRAEGEVLDDERLTPRFSQDLGRCLFAPAWCCSRLWIVVIGVDLLVGLEGFHLMSVARTQMLWRLGVESCIQLVGLLGCEVIAQVAGVWWWR